MVPPHRRVSGGLELAGRALEPAGRASEPAWRTLEPAGSIVLRYCRKYCQSPVLPSSAEIRLSMIYFGIIRHDVCLSVSGME